MAVYEEKESRDEVLHEVRRIKEELARSMDFDIDRIAKDARQRQKESGRKIIPQPVRKDAGGKHRRAAPPSP